MRFSLGGDNRITELSLGYRTRLGTGWDIPAGVLHAPGSVCTYEPQAASDVLCMCESWSNNREVPDELLWKDVPADRIGDLDYILDLLDWERNVDPDFVVQPATHPLRDGPVPRRRPSRATPRSGSSTSRPASARRSSPSGRAPP